MPIIVFGSVVDRGRIQMTATLLRASGYACRGHLIDDDDQSSWSGDALLALQQAPICVFVHSSSANESAAVSACVSAAFRGRKPIIPLRFDSSPYSAEMDYCLGPVQYIDAGADFASARGKLLCAIANLLKRPVGTESCRPHLQWIAVGIVAVLAVGAWCVFGPQSSRGFVLSVEPILSSGLDAVCGNYALDGGTGRVQVVVLDCVTGDYAALERVFAGGQVGTIARDAARRNAVLEPCEADRLMIPILAATAMRHAGVRRDVAIGDGDWGDACIDYWNRMLGDDSVERGLAALHLSTALQGRGVSADARRYSVSPYHLLQGFLGIVGEAFGSPGFDYCGGSENARAILLKMQYDDGLGLLTGALICASERSGFDGVRCGIAAGAVNFGDPCCMLFVRVETAPEDSGQSAEGHAMSLWHTLGLIVKAADEKWGGNGM